MLSQHLGDGEYQVGGGDPFPQPAGELKADNVRDQHRDRLAEHRSFGFDPAHAPSQHPEAVDHGGMRVGTHQRIRIGYPLFILKFTPYRFPQVLEIHLVADAGTRRYHAEAAEGLLTPFQELIAFVVALHLQTHILFKGVVIAEVVNGYGVVNNKIDRGKGINFGGVATEAFYRFAHGGQIHHRRHTGKVLH